ncbi:efflux RND transporter periplasmic adaptor subunit [Lentisphaera marina]|uniref:efflux RND transporter periplasmic adaptor subunit n=1 Tax=Lentisphaera marina TaxID=1111041 RepID=UPI0023655D7E|nr:efflux RND transporter periplasmic adaptor subunit [Lentisphaera marina]MDD7984355.1 efflux RND transporter periplasmic adaptor subunit [Lentisphaera marina]
MKKKLLIITIILFSLLGAGAFYKFKSTTTTQPASEGRIEVCAEHGFRKGECYQCDPQLLSQFKASHDWCVEHNLPESQCELCDPFAKFKAKGDWCKEHSAPESQCVKCDPSLATNQKPFIDWCAEHGVPESQCTICDPDRKYSLQSDWCQEHNTRDSECTLCHPELKVKTASSPTENTEWCEHGFAEGNCFSCDPSLESKFKETGDWCGGHDVPESQCFPCQHGLQEVVDKRLASKQDTPTSENQWCEHGFAKDDCFSCHPSLEAKFKETGDWCGGHGVPESQCFPCQSGLQETVNERLKVSTVRNDLQQQKRAIDISLEKELPPGAFCGTHLLRIKLSSKEMAKTIGLKYELIRNRPLTQSIKCNAEAVYNEDEMAKISSRFEGTIKAVQFQLGQKVKKGDLLLRINSPELAELRSQLNTEKALLSFTKSLHKDTEELLKILKNKKLSVSDATKNVSNLKVGAAKAELLTFISEMKAAEKNFDYEKQLNEGGLGLKANYLKAQKEYTAAVAGFGALLEKIALEIQQSLIVQQGKVDLIKRKMGVVESDKIDATGGNFVIRAPQSGTIVNKSVVEGEIIESGTVIASVVNLNKMWVKIDLRLDEANLVKPGQHVEFTTRGSYAQKFMGKIIWLGSEVNDKTRMVSALALVNSSDSLLRNNSYGKVRVHIHRDEEVIVVPKTALQWEGCCHVVFVKMAADVYAPRKVKLGYEGKDFFVVEAGLIKGEQVVTQGSFLLKTEILKSSIGAGCTD